jgi:hypothetical protein
MAPAMTHYLTYLTQKMTNDPEFTSKVVAYKYRLEKDARRRAMGKEHDRLTSQTAWMRTGIELIKQSHPNGGFAHPGLEIDLMRAFDAAIDQRRTMSQEASLSYRFMTSLAYLVQSGKIHGVEVYRNVENKLRHRPPINKFANQLCGWAPIETPPFWQLNHRDSRMAMWITACDADGGIDRAFLCVRGEEILTEIKQQLRNECPIVEGLRGVAQALLSDGIMQRGPKADRIGFSIALGEGLPETAVWKMSLRRILAVLGWMDDDIAPPQS